MYKVTTESGDTRRGPARCWIFWMERR